MKISLNISDELFETYVNRFGIPGCYAQMRNAVEAYRNVEKSDRVILLAGDQRRAIEAVFQTTVDDANKLTKLVQNMNSVKLGEVDMAFSEDQLERLAMQAKFHGRTTETYIREQVDEIKSAMLERV